MTPAMWFGFPRLPDPRRIGARANSASTLEGALTRVEIQIWRNDRVQVLMNRLRSGS